MKLDLTEFNKECALFVGATGEQLYSKNEDQDGLLWNFPRDMKLGLYRNYSTFGLKFDSDWNWLMEVVAKIKAVLAEAERRYSTAPEEQDFDYQRFLHRPTTCTKMEHLSAWDTKETFIEAVWEFLCWYKENKLKPNNNE